jgi:hypothetical protein
MFCREIRAVFFLWTVPMRGEKPAQIREGSGVPEGGPGPESIAYIVIFLGRIIFCRLYILNLLVQAQFNLQLRVRLTNLV